MPYERPQPGRLPDEANLSRAAPRTVSGLPWQSYCTGCHLGKHLAGRSCFGAPDQDSDAQRDTEMRRNRGQIAGS